ncbi:MAG TPA: hypothetical protein VMX16_18300 [Terriglobia bacterium]|nr:hypothetical protein [Terriglobia bacterium]
MRRLAQIILIAIPAYIVLLGATVAVMKQPPERFGRIMRHVPGFAFAVIPFKPLWLFARDGPLQVSDAAPAFTLPTEDKKSLVQLTSFRGKRPVVLVFGSYT